jgi:hypothetical protein
MDAQRLLRPSTFCDVLARARSAKVRGWWDGSAFRNHPCGLLVGNIRLANHWHVDNACSIVISTSDKWRLGSDDSFGYGDPFPKPIDGEVVSVWYSGRWVSEEYRAALEEKVVAILNRALADSAAADSWKAAIEAHANFCYRQKRDSVSKQALALATGAA